MMGDDCAQAHASTQFRPITDDYRFDFDAIVGRGASGTVHAAHRLADGHSVVIKEIAVDAADDDQSMAALQEAHTLAKFSHANIIQYHEARWNDGKLYIVMENAKGGDLAAIVHQQAQQRRYLSEDQIMLWFVQICLALWHVHSRGMLHRDLKTENVFMSNGVVKLGDFGIAQALDEGSDQTRTMTMMGTPYYLAPELCGASARQRYSTKSDVYALGCILYELATLKRAFDAPSLPALVIKIVQGSVAPIPSKFSSHMRGLIHSMLAQTPAKRPSVDAILKLPWLRRHLERFADIMIPISYEQLAAQSSAPQSAAPPGAARASAYGRPQAHKSSRAGAAGAHPDRTPEPLDTDLSSLSSISSHPLHSACGVDSTAGSPAVRNPFAALEEERTLRHSNKPPQNAEVWPQTLPPPGHLRARTSGQTSRTTTATGSSDKAEVTDVASTQGAAAVTDLASAGSPCLKCSASAVRAEDADLRAAPADTGADADAWTRRQVRSSWVAGNLAQLEQLEQEFERCSPQGSPLRRRAQRQQELSAPHVAAHAAPLLSPRDRCMSDAALGQASHTPSAVSPAHARVAGVESCEPLQEQKSGVDGDTHGHAVITKAERARTEPAQGLPTLQQAFAVRREEHKAHLQQHAELRQAKIRDKQAAQRQHKAALRRARPQVRRQSLQEMGQAFAVRSENVVCSKTATQQAQAPSFIVRAQTPAGTTARTSHSAASSSKCAWTVKGLQAQSSAQHHADVNTGNAKSAAAAKPWRQRSSQRQHSAMPNVQIFVPDTDKPTAACLQQDGCVRPPAAGAHEESFGGLCMRSPVERLSQLRELTTSFEALQHVGADGSPHPSPIGKRHAALTGVQAFLDPDAVPATQRAPTGSSDVRSNAHAGAGADAPHVALSSTIESGAARDVARPQPSFESASAQDVEERRLRLEAQLGAGALMRACDHVQRQAQQDTSAADGVRSQLHEMLGGDSESVSAVLELMLMEQAVFGRGQ